LHKKRGTSPLSSVGQTKLPASAGSTGVVLRRPGVDDRLRKTAAGPWGFRRGGARSSARAVRPGRPERFSETDAVYLLQFNFLGGPAPPAPFPECAASLRSEDERLGCAEPPASCR
jgi:hypothetical protein